MLQPMPVLVVASTSEQDEGSVEGGNTADDACECNTPRYNADTQLCGEYLGKEVLVSEARLSKPS